MEAALPAPSYAAYLDALISDEDRGFLGDEGMARSLLELGHRGGGGTILKRSEFEAKAAAAASASAAAARGGVMDLLGHPALAVGQKYARK